MTLYDALHTPIAWFYRNKIRYPKGHKNEDIPVVYTGNRCCCTVWTNDPEKIYIFTLEPPHTYKEWMSNPYLHYAYGCAIDKSSGTWGTVFYEDGVIKEFGEITGSIPWTYVCGKPIENKRVESCPVGHAVHPNWDDKSHVTFVEGTNCYRIEWVYQGSVPYTKSAGITSAVQERSGLFTRVLPLIIRYCTQARTLTIKGDIPDVLIQDGNTVIYVDSARDCGFVIPDIHSKMGKYSISSRRYYGPSNLWEDANCLFIGTAYWRTYVHSRINDATRNRPVWVPTGVDNLLSVDTPCTEATNEILSKIDKTFFDTEDMFDHNWLPRWIVANVTDSAMGYTEALACSKNFINHGLDALAMAQLFHPSMDLKSSAKRYSKKQLVLMNKVIRNLGIDYIFDSCLDLLCGAKIPDDIDVRALSDDVFNDIFIKNFNTLRDISGWYFEDCLNRVCSIRPSVKKLANMKAMIEYFGKVYSCTGQVNRTPDYIIADYLRLLVECRNVRGFDPCEYTLFPDVNRLLRLHDRLVAFYNNNRDEVSRRKAEELNRKFAAEMKQREYLTYEGEKFVMVLPKNTGDLIDEGSTLHHCVGTYCESVANGRETIVFLRRKETPEEPFLTVDVTNDGNIRQIHGKYNCNVGELPESTEIWKFVEDWCDAKKLNKQSLSGCGRVCCHL